jgi:hypothetical protein
MLRAIYRIQQPIYRVISFCFFAAGLLYTRHIRFTTESRLPVKML